MDYSKLAEGIFSSLSAEDESESDADSEISTDAKNNTDTTSLISSLLSSNINRGLAALSAAGMITGIFGAIYSRVQGLGDGTTVSYGFLGIGVAAGIYLLGRAGKNKSAEQSIKNAEALVKATERYILKESEQQKLEAKAAEEVAKAAEQTKAASSFLSGSKAGTGLGIDFSNPFNLSGAMGNLGDFNASSGRNTGVVMIPNHSAEKFSWL
jgi:hypothetical protein